MKLPENKVGISDMLDWRECPRRMIFGMRRHTAEGEPPEKMGPSNAYGTIVHDVFHWIEIEGLTDEEAIQRAFDVHGKWLEPEDMEMLEQDVEKYHEREYTGVRLIGSEMEVTAPLTRGPDGSQIYYRARIDRLYQFIARPQVFLAIDYKSSKHRKSEQEIHADPQLWSYNWVLHEQFPEIERLFQHYDQLRFGVETTSKTPQQREQIKRWLARQAWAVAKDDTGEPKFNQWCPWCPIMESCPVIQRLSTYALAELAAIAPERRNIKKDGSTGKRVEAVELDPALFETYVGELATVHTAKAVLDRFEASVKRALLDMPAQRRADLGYRVTDKRVTSFPREAVEAIHRDMGDEDFYELVTLSKTALERALAEEPERLARILGMADVARGARQVVPER